MTSPKSSTFANDYMLPAFTVSQYHLYVLMPWLPYAAFFLWHLTPDVFYSYWKETE